MTTRRWALALAFVVAGAAPVVGQPAVAAGTIKIASGAAEIVRASGAVRAKVGDIVYQSDTLRTGVGGKIGFTLKDDTRVSLGPSSEVRVERFVYAPAQGRLGMVLRVTRGVAAYVSGQIAKLAPDAVRLETPSAIIGVRGTSLAVKVGT